MEFFLVFISCRVVQKYGSGSPHTIRKVETTPVMLTEERYTELDKQKREQVRQDNKGNCNCHPVLWQQREENGV